MTQPATLMGVLLAAAGIIWILYEAHAEMRKGPLAERREIERAVYAENPRLWGGRLKLSTLIGGVILFLIGATLVVFGDLWS